jgi:predicted Zn-dependent protease
MANRTWLLLAAFFIVLGALLTRHILSERVDRGFLVASCGEERWAPADIPVPVYLDAGSVEWADDVVVAIAFWAPYLRYAGTLPADARGADPIVRVVTDAALAGGMEEDGNASPAEGESTLSWDAHCRLRRVEVRLPPPPVSQRMRLRIAEHELGHALGLDHDSEDIMRPRMSAMLPAGISHHDAELLLHAYSAGLRGRATEVRP